MNRPIVYPEYRRRVFNKVLIECLCKVHGRILNDCDDACDACNGESEESLSKVAAALCTKFSRSDEETSGRSGTLHPRV